MLVLRVMLCQTRHPQKIPVMQGALVNQRCLVDLLTAGKFGVTRGGTPQARICLE